MHWSCMWRRHPCLCTGRQGCLPREQNKPRIKRMETEFLTSDLPGAAKPPRPLRKRRGNQNINRERTQGTQNISPSEVARETRQTAPPSRKKENPEFPMVGKLRVFFNEPGSVNLHFSPYWFEMPEILKPKCPNPKQCQKFKNRMTKTACSWPSAENYSCF